MFDIISNEQNMRNQEELNKDQFMYQLALNKQGQRLGMQTWKATSYPAQVEMMKQAGLNPALMYGQGGGSGGTTSTPSGGGASGSQAPRLDFGTIMDIGIAKSQIDLNQANATKAINEADLTAGATKDKTIAETELLKQNKEYQNTMNTIATIDAEIAKEAKTDEIIKRQGEAQKLVAEINKLILENKITEKTAQYQILEAGYNATNAYLQGKSIQAGINLTEQQTKESANNIIQSIHDTWAKTTNAISNKQNADTMLHRQIQDQIHQDANLRHLSEKQKHDMAMDIFGLILGRIPQKTTQTISTEDNKGNWRSSSSTTNTNQ